MVYVFKYLQKLSDYRKNRLLFAWFIFILPAITPSYAEETYRYETNDSTEVFDNLLINVYYNPDLSFDLEVIITGSNELYVNMQDLFQKIEIPVTAQDMNNHLTGMIGSVSKSFSVSFPDKEISIDGKIFSAKEDGLIKENGVLYLKTALLHEAFGLHLIFNQRSLSAKLSADFELSFIKRLRLENMRKKISKLQGEPQVVDTIVERNYHLFRFGMLDWAFSSYQTLQKPAYNYLSLAAGAELLFGQANFSMNYNDYLRYDPRQLNYNWRWIENNNKLLRQAQVGVMHKQVIAAVNSPIIGASVSNSPTTVRKAKGYYTINEYTEPNWTVELYLNEVLFDYTTADASGLYTFKVPIIYGYTGIRLKFYSPLGEERTEERSLNVPFTFLPANTFEYELTGGVTQIRTDREYGLASINYGLSPFITIGGGLEYLSSIPDRPFIPFTKLSVQPVSKMVVNLEYAHNVGVKGLINYNFSRNAFLEFNYEKYNKFQLATRLKALEERKVRLTLPLKIRRISLFNKINLNQFRYENFVYNQANYVCSAYYRQYSTNTSFILNWVNDKPAFITSNISLSYRFRNGLVFRPVVEYNLSNNRLIRLRGELEKRISKIYFSLSWEKNFASETSNFFINCRYDLPFARTGFSVSADNNTISFAENIQGSLAFGGDNNFVKTGNNSSIGKGGILFYPFLDLNENGIQDAGEQRILLSLVKVPGGKAVVSPKDSIVRISDLNAFVKYTIEFSDNDLENIAWRFRYKKFEILVDPNTYKHVSVPIVAVGEVNGYVYFNDGSARSGLGRMLIQVYDEQGKLLAESLSESDGYFSYLGLSPGNYTVHIDPVQLETLGYKSSPVFHEAAIEISTSGDIVGGLDFIIRKR